MAKKSSKKRGKTSRKKAASGSSGENLGGMSTEALQAELRRRQQSTRALERDVEAELASHGSPITSSGGVRKRPKNEKNLEEALKDLLTNKVMGVTEAAEAVQRAGYMTSSVNFRTIVNQTLIRSKKFKKVSRGQYTAR